MPSETETTETKITKLIMLLIKKTGNKEIKWDTTPDDDVYRYESPSANIKIDKSEGFDPDSENSYCYRRFEIFNDKGRLLERFVPGDTLIELFDELYDLARRSALNTDKVLDSLMDEIRGDGPF